MTELSCSELENFAGQNQGVFLSPLAEPRGTGEQDGVATFVFDHELRTVVEQPLVHIRSSRLVVTCSTPRYYVRTRTVRYTFQIATFRMLERKQHQNMIRDKMMSSEQ